MTIDQDVLTVLAEGHSESQIYFLPQGQLDRKLYMKVNEVLTRIGGKWNRKSKGHVFEDDLDPAQLIRLVIDTEEMPPKNPTAFFPTPPDVAERLLTDPRLPRIPQNAKMVLEPSAGKGDLAEAVRDHLELCGINAQIDVLDILPRFTRLLFEWGFNLPVEGDACSFDFLRYEPREKYDAVVMNPPFAVEGDPLAYVTHIEHSWSFLKPGGVLLAVVPGGFGFRQDKKVVKLREYVEAWGTWFPIEDGAFKESGTGVKTILLGVTPGVKGGNGI